MLTMNSIKTKLRSSMGQDMLNKVMHINLIDLDLEDERVFLNHWLKLSQNRNNLIIGKLKIPALLSLRESYKKR